MLNRPTYFYADSSTYTFAAFWKAVYFAAGTVGGVTFRGAGVGVTFVLRARVGAGHNYNRILINI